MKLNTKIQLRIETETGSRIISTESLSGGCISNAYKITLESGENLFLKYNSSVDMFLKEANGLRELKKANAVKVPGVILAEKDFILLEFFNTGSPGKNFFEDFGRKFAQLHKFTGDSFGFYEDNYIGSTLQLNIPDKNERNNWTDFYLNKRILFQYRLAEKNGYADTKLKEGIKKLENKIPDIISGSEEKPSLLHGDLWSGNYLVDESGEACLIDPAVYYGHREADLAMTKLFGGFNHNFYRAYNNEFPLPEGYEYRENLYKLYHVLNHLNLFGRGYYSQSIALINFYI